jgi:hypothetical protein
MQSYSDYLRRDTEFLIRRFRQVKLANLERMIIDTMTRIHYTEIHREELLSTKKGRAEQVKFMKMMSTKTEAEKLAMRFKVRPETNYWLVGPYPPSQLPIPPVPKRQTETEAEIRAFPASLRLKPQQAHLA